MLLITAAPGQALWPVLHDGARAAWTTNSLDTPQRLEHAGVIAVSMFLGLAYYVGAWAWYRAKRDRVSFPTFAGALNAGTRCVVVLPWLSTVLFGELEASHPIVEFGLITATAITLTVWLASLDVFERAGDLSGRAAALATAALGVGYAVVTAYLSLVDHHGLSTSFLDLAVYDNIVWNTAQGRWLDCSMCAGGNHASVHYDPILIVVAQLYRLQPQAETLLVLQSAWLALGVIPMFRLGKRRLGRNAAGVAMAAVYVLYPALHGANLYDFHSLTLAIPLLVLAVDLIDAGATKRTFAVLVALFLCRDDVALLTCVFGAYAALRGRPRLAIGIVLASVGYFAFARGYVMAGTRLLAKGHFVGRYSDMIPNADENLRGLVVTMATNPAYTASALVRPEKLTYYVALLAPLGFVPLLAPRKLVLTAYGLVFIGLSNHAYHYSLHFQYGSVLFPMLLAAVPDGAARLGARWAARSGRSEDASVRRVLVGIVVASALSATQFGALVPNASFRGGWTRIEHRLDPDARADLAALRTLTGRIAPDASVCASDHLAPHVSNRQVVRRWPRCKRAEAFLVDVARMKNKSKATWRKQKQNLRLVTEARGLQLWMQKNE